MHSRSEVALAAAALAVLTPAGAQADEVSAGELTVTATRTPTPLSQVGSSVSVVTAQDIQDQQLQTLPDVLQTIAGLNLVQTGGPGGETSVFMRGTNANHVKVLIDGIDVSDVSSTSGTFAFEHLLTADIARVEVLRGPQSGLYGSDAIGGVIDVVTRRGSGPFSAYGSAEGGTFDTDNETGGFSGQLRGFHYAVSLAHDRSGATPVTPPELLPAGQPGNDDAYDNLTGSTKLGLDLSKSLDVGFVGRVSDARLRYTGDDFSLFPAVPAPVQSSTRSQLYAARGYVHLSLWDGRFDQTAGLAFSSDKREELSWPATSPDVYHGARTKLDWRGVVELARGERLTLGAEHEHDQYLSPIEASTDTASGYAQLQSTIGDFGNAANLRYDANSRFGGKATFRIAPSYLVAPLGLQLKGSYGTGFKAPSLDDLFHSYPAFDFYANPDLRPETSQGWDLGFEERLDHGRASFGATYFHNSIRDLIEENSSFTSLINVGRARTYGVESFAAYAPLRTLQLRADYTYTVAKDADTGEELARRPRHKLAVQADWRPAQRLQLSARLTHLSSWTDDSRDFTATGLTAPGYTLVNVGAAYDLRAGLTVYGRVTNLGDIRYQSPTGFLGPGRGVFGGIRARY